MDGKRIREAVLTVLAAVLALVLAAGAVVGRSSENTYTAEQRRAMATEVWADIALRYSYFDDKGLDWDEIGREYIGLAEAAKSDREFFSTVAAMVRQLHDGHSYVYGYPLPVAGEAWGATAVDVGLVEDKPTIITVRTGSDAERQGVAPGMQVAEVGGVAAAAVLDRLQPSITASTPWYARSAAARALLNGTVSRKADVLLSDGAGGQLAVELERAPSVRSVEPIAGRVLSGNVGYIRLASFSTGGVGVDSAAALRAAFDRALEAVRGCSALVIDVRGNGGGDDRMADACAARLVSAATDFPGFQMRLVTWGKAWFAPMMRRSVAPRGFWQYAGPVVLCIDEFVFSSAEHFVAGLHDSGRAVTVGGKTAGASGNPVQREVAGFRYQISRWREIRTTGELIEGGGVPADVQAVRTAAGVRAGRDEVLERAVEVALEMASQKALE